MRYLNTIKVTPIVHKLL